MYCAHILLHIGHPFLIFVDFFAFLMFPYDSFCRVFFLWFFSTLYTLVILIFSFVASFLSFHLFFLFLPEPISPHFFVSYCLSLLPSIGFSFLLSVLSFFLFRMSLCFSVYYFFLFFFCFLIGIHSMQGWTATTRHGVTRERSKKRLKHTRNLFRKNPQLKGVC